MYGDNPPNFDSISKKDRQSASEFRLPLLETSIGSNLGELPSFLKDENVKFKFATTSSGKIKLPPLVPTKEKCVGKDDENVAVSALVHMIQSLNLEGSERDTEGGDGVKEV